MVKYVKILHIDPDWQRIPSAKRAYIQFPGGIIFPRPGLYYLNAHYPGDSWCFTFTARH